jgi:predicted dehydrogenase
MVFKVVVVVGNMIEKEIEKFAIKEPRFICLKHLSELNEIVNNQEIIDICTPTETHSEVLFDMVSRGFKNFIVEKPLTTTIGDLEKLKSVNIHVKVVHNYLFSQATRKILELIEQKEIEPVALFSFFCKDRKSDTILKRGFNEASPPHVFTIEIPHQLYLATAIAGKAKVLTASSNAMKINKTVFNCHGFGAVQFEHHSSKNQMAINSFHFSCLYSDNCVKRIVIIGKDGKKMTIDYPITPKLLSSNIFLEQNKKLIYQEQFSNDDMLYHALQYYVKNVFIDYDCYGRQYIFDSSFLLVEAFEQNEESDCNCSNCLKVCEKYSISIPCSPVI